MFTICECISTLSVVCTHNDAIICIKIYLVGSDYYFKSFDIYKLYLAHICRRYILFVIEIDSTRADQLYCICTGIYSRDTKGLYHLASCVEKRCFNSLGQAGKKLEVLIATWHVLVCILIFNGPFHQAAVTLWWNLHRRLHVLETVQDRSIQHLERYWFVLIIYGFNSLRNSLNIISYCEF